MAGPNDLQEACEQYLDACAEAVTAASLASSSPAIDRVYVSPGPPAWDCSQLTVYAGGPVEADTAPLQPPLQPGYRVDVTGSVNLVTLTATVIRCCVPVPTALGENLLDPDPADIEQVAAWTNADLWAIWNHVKAKKRDGTLFPPVKTRALFLDPAVALGAQGGCAGWQIAIRVQLDGYSEAP